VTATGAFGTFLWRTDRFSDGLPFPCRNERSVERSTANRRGWLDGRPLQFGDALPHLFVSDWVNGSPGCFDAAASSDEHDGDAGMVLIPGDTDVFEIDMPTPAGTSTTTAPRRILSRRALVRTFTFFGLTQWFGEVAAGSSVLARGWQRRVRGASGLTRSTPWVSLADRRYPFGRVRPTMPFTPPSDVLQLPQFCGPGGCAAFLGSSTAITSTAPSNRSLTRRSRSAFRSRPREASGPPPDGRSRSPTTQFLPGALSGSNGTATGTCSITEQAAGNYSLTASYPGDDNFDSSATPRSTSVTVGQATPSTPTISNLRQGSPTAAASPPR